MFKEEDPTAQAGGENKWQKGILEWISTQENPLYNPPNQYCEGGGSGSPINVEFNNPTDRTSNLPNQFPIKFSATATNTIAEFKLEIDGTNVKTFSSPPYSYDADLEDGVHALRAVAKDEKGNESDRKIIIGVNATWDSE